MDINKLIVHFIINSSPIHLALCKLTKILICNATKISSITAQSPNILKTKNNGQRKLADLRLFNLEDRQADYGAIALIEREVELLFTEAQLASVNTALSEVAARKAAL